MAYLLVDNRNALSDNVDMGRRKRSSLDGQLLTAIKNSGLTQYRLAKMSGVSVTIICRFINGERSLALPTASKLADALGLELAKKKAKRGG